MDARWTLCLVAAALASGGAGALYGVHSRREAAYFAVAADQTTEPQSTPFSLTGWRSASGTAAVGQRDGPRVSPQAVETATVQSSPGGRPQHAIELPSAPTQDASPAPPLAPDVKRTPAEMAPPEASRSAPSPVDILANKEQARDLPREPALAAIIAVPTAPQPEEVVRGDAPPAAPLHPPAAGPGVGSEMHRPDLTVAPEPVRQAPEPPGKAETIAPTLSPSPTMEARTPPAVPPQPIAAPRATMEVKRRMTKIAPASASDGARLRPKRIALKPKPPDPEPHPMETLPKRSP